MSAFIVSQTHIDTLVSAAISSRLSWYQSSHRKEAFTEGGDAIGAILFAQNYASVNHRYGEKDEPRIYSFRYQRLPEPVAVLKAIACYEYQACETPDWKETEAAAFCDALRHATIYRLPGYETAPWEIRDNLKAAAQ